MPVSREHPTNGRVRLTGSMVATLAAYCRTGSVKDAAALLGKNRHTVANDLSAAYYFLDSGSAFEAAAKLGWLTVPDQPVPPELEMAEMAREDLRKAIRSCTVAINRANQMLERLGTGS